MSSSVRTPNSAAVMLSDAKGMNFQPTSTLLLRAGLSAVLSPALPSGR